MKAFKLCLIIGFLGWFFHLPLVASFSHQIKKSDDSGSLGLSLFCFDDKQEKDPGGPFSHDFDFSEADLSELNRRWVDRLGFGKQNHTALSHYLIAIFHTGPPYSPS